jgi:hypothetical protein
VQSRRPIGRFLQTAFGEQDPLVAVDAAGALPYFAPKLRMLDMLGLNDRFLAHNPPPSLGHGLVGHELGNGAYLLRRKPDIIAFHHADGHVRAMWRTGVEAQRTREFRRFYQLVTFDTLGQERVRPQLWVRREDGKIGATRGQDEIVVPGFLASSLGNGVVAMLDREGRMGAVLDGRSQARLDWLHVPPGDWEIRVESTGPVHVRVQAAWPPGGAESNDGVARFVVEGRMRTTIELTAADSTAHVRRVVLTRHR